MTRTHGTRSCFQGGCRRPECVEADRVYSATYKQRRRRLDGKQPRPGDEQRRQVLDVAVRHTTWAAADWAGIHRGTAAEWARVHLGLRRGAGRPSVEEINRSKPRPGCGCPMCDEWETARAAEVAALYGFGWSEDTIGERLDVTARQVVRWLDRAGVARRIPVSVDLIVPPAPADWEPPTVAEVAGHGEPVDGLAERAACRGVDPALFYPARGESTEVARAVCASCPVILDCAAAGVGEKHGMWGGLSERQRRQMRTKVPRWQFRCVECGARFFTTVKDRRVCSAECAVEHRDDSRSVS